MVCKDICLKYKAKGVFLNGRYIDGQKRCNSCDIFIHWDGIWCPCCGFRLRTKPRYKKRKTKLKECNGDKIV